jgi:hypothetical protein
MLKHIGNALLFLFKELLPCMHFLLKKSSRYSLFCSRAAMMEFEINMSEMPLGKLSKENIQKGVLF